MSCSTALMWTRPAGTLVFLSQNWMPQCRKKIRARCERMVASQLARDYRDVQEKLEQDLEFSFGIAAPGALPVVKPASPTPDLIDLRLTVHSPAYISPSQNLPAQIEPQFAEPRTPRTMIVHIFPTFPTGQNSDPRSFDGLKRSMQWARQQMEANREAQQNQPAQPVR